MGVVLAFPEEKSLRPVTNDRLRILFQWHRVAVELLDEVYADLAAGAPMLATEYTLPEEKPDLPSLVLLAGQFQNPTMRRRPRPEPESTA